MHEDTKLLTTGEIARYCGVSRMGVIRWIRQGKLKAFTTPGGHYRVRPSDFRTFLEEFDIPVVPSFLSENKRILVIANEIWILGTIVKALTAMQEEFEVEVALDGISAVKKLKHLDPILVILDVTIVERDSPESVRQLQSRLDRQGTALLILAPSTFERKVGEDPTFSAAKTALLRRESLEVGILQSKVHQLLSNVKSG